MPANPSSSVVLDVNAGSPVEELEALPIEAASDDPFRILILGDFSGRPSRPSLASRRPLRIDRDNFDNILGNMHVAVTLELDPATTVRLKFAALTDFEPDAIFQRCELFHGAAAQNPAPARPAASEQPRPSQPRPSLESDAVKLTSGSLLDEIVEQADADRPTEARNDLQSVIERVVAPHIVRDSHEERSAQERAHSVLMRAILHHPRFQALEAAWRALDWLTRGLDTDGALSLHVFDVTRDELEREAHDLTRHLAEEPWAVIASNYVFDRSGRDVALLQRLGELARRAGSPWIAESAPPDEDSENREWRALRGSPEASWIGLALPRFLARMPYGRASYAIESFPFEEFSGSPEHNHFLWANPAFACALLLGRAFNEYGWRFRPDAVRQMAGLPFYAFEAEGEMRSQPCAEVLLTDSQIDFIQEQGVMALAAMKNRDVAMLMRFQSIADPVTALAGRWR